MKRRILPAALLAAALLIPLSACSSSNEASDASVGGPAPLHGPEAQSYGEAMDGDFSDGVASAMTSDEARADRSIIRTGEVYLEVRDPSSAAEQVAEVAASLGGRIESSNVSRAEDDIPAEASVTLRVPEQRSGEVFTALAELGEVVSQQRSDTDVTSEHVDLQARVDALDESVKRLTELMADAKSTGELLKAEAALSERQQELDGLRAQLKSLEGRVSEATVYVSLSTKTTLPGGGPANFWEGLLAGFGSLAATGAGALVVLGVALPWVTVLGIVAVIVVLVVRGAARRRRIGAAAPTLQVSEQAQQTPAFPPAQERTRPAPPLSDDAAQPPAPGNSRSSSS